LAVVAGIAHAITVEVLLACVRLCRTVVASVPNLVAVEVNLRAVGDRGTVITLVRLVVAISIERLSGTTGVTLDGIEDPVAVGISGRPLGNVAVDTGGTDSWRTRYRLGGVGYIRTVVAEIDLRGLISTASVGVARGTIWHTIVVRIQSWLACISNVVMVGVELVRIVLVPAVVAPVADTIAIRISIARVV
jgi:hypothetical protein